MQLRAHLRRLQGPSTRREEWLSLGAWILAIAALETAGPRSPSDAIDGLLLAGLLALAGGTHLLHRNVHLRWVAAVGRAWRGARARLVRLWPGELRLGIDYRRHPPLPQGVPRPLLLEALGATVVLAVALTFGHLFPEGLRGLAHTAYVPYLVVLGALWAMTWFGIFMGIMLPIVALGERASTRGPAEGRTRRVALQSLTLFAALSVAAYFLPAWMAARGVAITTALLVVGLALVPVRHGFVWCQGGRKRGLSWRTFGLWISIFFVALAFTPLLLGMGDEVLGDPQVGTSLALTRAMGRALAWSLLCLSATLLAMLVGLGSMAFAFERARRTPGRLRLEGAPDPEDRTAVRALGWRLAGDEARRGELRLRVEAGAATPDQVLGPTLPGAVPPGWLSGAAAGPRLARARVLDLRRRIVRGICGALETAATRTFERGTGYFLAPHLWFMSGLTRDEDEADQGPGRSLGLPWDRRMTWEARAYLYDVLDDLAVDLVFVEDGVRARSLGVVLRRLFEVHDTHGAQPILERQLALIPGVRAIVQDDVDGESALSDAGYPEPDYEDVGRARLLLIFKDRGGDRDGAEDPVDARGRPAPAVLG